MVILVESTGIYIIVVLILKTNFVVVNLKWNSCSSLIVDSN